MMKNIEKIVIVNKNKIERRSNEHRLTPVNKL